MLKYHFSFSEIQLFTLPASQPCLPHSETFFSSCKNATFPFQTFFFSLCQQGSQPFLWLFTPTYHPGSSTPSPRGGRPMFQNTVKNLKNLGSEDWLSRNPCKKLTKNLKNNIARQSLAMGGSLSRNQ